MPNTLLPRLLFRAVEDDKVALIHTANNVHVFGGLLQTFLNDCIKSTTFDFQLQHNALHRASIAVGEWFADKQISALTTQTILAVDITAAIDDALKETL